MSSNHNDYESIDEPKSFEVPDGWYTYCFLLVAVGAIAFVGGLATLEDTRRVWSAYLIGFWFTFGLSLAGPFIAATQWLSTGSWGVSIRRVLESFGMYLLPASLLGIVMLLGAQDILPWMGVGAHDISHHSEHIIDLKRGFLNTTGLIGVTVAAPLVIFGFAYWLRHNSIKQDETGDPTLTDKNKTLSTFFLFAFVIGFSLMSWYWMLSLEPLWYATMWQVYNFAALFQSGLALVTIVVIMLMKKDLFGDFVGEYQIHSLGQMVFSFTIFYAYIAFCQFMLCWYANIPEESLFYIRRLGGLTPGDEWGGYGWFGMLWLVKFIAPFLILLPQQIKKNRGNILYYVCWVILAAQIYEIWYWVAFSTSNPEPTTDPNIYVPWLEVLVVGGFIGLFMAVVARSLASANILPTKDPFLHEALEHNLGHHHGDDHDSDETD